MSKRRFVRHDYLQALFNPGDFTCFSSDIKGTQVSDAFSPPPHARFVCIHPLHPFADLNPTAVYHSARLPRRADVNCTSFRTFLCEFDKISLDDQLAFIEHIGLPVTTLTYSGGKSIHALIVLNQSVIREEYDRLVKKIYRALGSEVDAANKNPSRLTRLPDAVRENGVTQDLILVKERVSLTKLEDWLHNRGVTDEVQIPTQTHFEGILHGRQASTRLSENSVRFLMGVYEEGTWNHQLFRTCCELFKRGGQYAEVHRQCEQITGHLDAKDVHTIRSAYKTVKGAVHP